MPYNFRKISFEEYLADEAIDYTGLKVFARSPHKYKYLRDHQGLIESTPSQIQGTALHYLLSEGEDAFAARYGVESAPRKGTRARIAWDQANSQAIPLSPRMWDEVFAQRESFQNAPDRIKELLKDGVSEISIFWRDPITGLHCKARPDWLRIDDIIVDFKTTKNGDPNGFRHEIYKYKYYWQAEFYLRGLDCAYKEAGINRRAQRFIFVTIEKTPPYEIGAYRLDQDFLERGEAEIDKTLSRYQRCLVNDVWPGYAEEIVTLSP